MDSCFFCERPKNEVKSLVESPKRKGVFICDRCVTASSQALSQGRKNSGKPEDKPLPFPKQIREHLDKYVISQTDTKKAVSVAVYNHYKRREAIRRGVNTDTEISKSNILLMGPSGCGKTEIARSIARILGVPFYVGDATKLTSAGYVGDDVESLLQGLLAACDGDAERAQWGIVFLDEADKLARKSGRGATGFRDVSGEGVQQSLLKLVEGSKVHVPRGMARMGTTDAYDMLDTENILFIFAGSFAGIEGIVKDRVNKSAKLGFGATARKNLDDTEVFSQVTEEDILEFGIIPELLGRIPVHTSVKPLTEDEMLQILTEPKNAIIRQFQALFEMDNIQLTFDEAALRAIAREAKSRPTGARSLRSIVERVLQEYCYECPGDPEVKAIRVLEETVTNQAAAIVVRESVQHATA